MISRKIIQKELALAKLVDILNKKKVLTMDMHSEMLEIFNAGEYVCKSNNPLNKVQIVCSLLYEHFRCGKRPIIYRYGAGINIFYTLKQKKSLQLSAKGEEKCAPWQ